MYFFHGVWFHILTPLNYVSLECQNVYFSAQLKTVLLMKFCAFFKILLFICIVSNLVIAQQNIFPPLQKRNDTLKIGNKIFIDEYAVLNTKNPASLSWLEAQDNYFADYEKNLSSYDAYFNLIEINKTKTNRSLFLGEHFFRIYYNQSGEGIYRLRSKDAPIELIIDNNDIITQKNKFANFRSLKVSANSDYLAYTFSINGSEVLGLKVYDLRKDKHLPDLVKDIISEDIQWYKDGFFYTDVDSNEVFYHKLNTAQSSDSIIIPAAKHKSSSNKLYVMNNERYLIMKSYSYKTKQTNIYQSTLTQAGIQYSPLILKQEAELNLIEADDTLIYFTTRKKNIGQCLFSIHPQNTNQWKLIIEPASNELLKEIKILNKNIVAVFAKGPYEHLKIFDLAGNLLSVIELPLGISIDEIQAPSKGSNFYFNLESINLPPLTYVYNLKNNTYEPLNKIQINHAANKIESIYEEAVAHDGKKIPILITKLVNVKLEQAPTLLESYGGYGISMNNGFDAEKIEFIEHGGVYVKAYIRGGGELGEEWHLAGSGVNKSKTYLDFISTAKYLINKSYTSSNKLAITGTSHGGLVVGVAYTQHPELFKAVIINAAPLDIISFLQSHNSLFSYSEFGNLNVNNELDSIIKYNPYYNIKKEYNYPSILICAAQNDQRVSFTNSGKFVAKLQNRKSQFNPVLFLLEKDAGHFGNEKKYDDVYKKKALFNRFLYKELNF